MAGGEIRRIRQQPGNEVSEGQVELLRAVRRELSSWRGQVMLDIDGAQEDLRAALRECSQAPCAWRSRPAWRKPINSRPISRRM